MCSGMKRVGAFVVCTTSKGIAQVSRVMFSWVVQKNTFSVQLKIYNVKVVKLNWLEDPLIFFKIKNPFGYFQTNPNVDAWWISLISFVKNVFLAPTGALIVMICYYIFIRNHFFRFSLSPLMQLMLPVSL